MSATITPTFIHQSPGNLWLGVPLPATGARLIIDSAGAPVGGGRFVGATSGPVTVALAPKYETLGIDQVTGPVDALMTAESASIEVTLEELQMANLRDALGVGTYSSGTDTNLPAGAQAYEEITFGGLIAVPKLTVAAISPRRDATGKFVVAMLYQAYSAEAVQLPFQRGKTTAFKVKFDGLAIPSRPVGDQLGQIYRQT